MSARKARTEAAAAGAAPVDSEEKDVKIPVEAADDTEVNEAPAAEAAENQVEDSNKEATMTEDEMVEAAIRAGEEAADNDFKLKFEQAQKELADVRNELDAAAEAQKAAEDKAKDATERTARLQADWENFRRRTANERIAERERATEKLVTALLPVIDDIERAIDHARSQELSDDFKQFVDGVDAVHAKLLDVFAHEGVEPIDPKGEAFDPLEHQAVGRVEDASQYDETVNDVYQKGYRMADRILGMGDIVGLVEHAAARIDEEQAAKSMDRMMSGKFDFNDFLDQMKMMQNLGPLEGLLGLLPGFGKIKKQLPEGALDPKRMKHMEAIVLSMTAKERSNPNLLNPSRRRRIAAGCGRPLMEVNKLIKNFSEMCKMMSGKGKMGAMMKQMASMKGKGGKIPGLPGMGGGLGGLKGLGGLGGGLFGGRR